MKIRGVILLGLSLMLFACSEGRKAPDVSDVEVSFDTINFYDELLRVDSANFVDEVMTLKTKYPSFMEAYSHRVIRIGYEESPRYYDNLSRFVYFLKIKSCCIRWIRYFRITML